MMGPGRIGHILSSLSFLPFLAGLVLITIPETGGLGLLLLLTWPLPIIVLDRRKASGAASLTATGIAIALLAAVKLLTTQVHRPPDEVELGLTGAVASVLAALSLVSLLLGTGLGVRAYRRRQPGGKAALAVNLVALGTPILLCVVAELRS